MELQDCDSSASTSSNPVDSPDFYQNFSDTSIANSSEVLDGFKPGLYKNDLMTT